MMLNSIRRRYNVFDYRSGYVLRGPNYSPAAAAQQTRFYAGSFNSSQVRPS